MFIQELQIMYKQNTFLTISDFQWTYPILYRKQNKLLQKFRLF